MSELLAVSGSTPGSGVLLLKIMEVGGCRAVCDVNTSPFYNFIPPWNCGGELGSGCN